MKSILILTALFFLQPLFAMQFDGEFIRIKNKNYFISQLDGVRYQLTGQSPVISSQLNKLSDGDFLSLDGTLTENQELLIVKTINYVGLKAMLGTWNGDDNRCYNFTSHTDFTVSVKVGEYCLKNRNSNYKYLLNPDSEQWVMLVAGEYNSYVGDVDFITNENVVIDLYDSQTGEIRRKLTLKKKLNK